MSVSQAQPAGLQVPCAVPLAVSARLSVQAVALAPSQRAHDRREERWRRERSQTFQRSSTFA